MNKRFLALILSLMLLMTCCCAVAEEEEDGDCGGPVSLLSAFDEQVGALLYCDNVTVNIDAVFSIDGKEFKHAKVSHIQSWASSLREVVMLTPLADGSIRESGYTVHAINTSITAMESGNADTGELLCYEEENAKETILKHRNGLPALADLARSAVERAEQVLTANQLQITSQEDDSTVIHVRVTGDELPDMVDPLLTMCFHYFNSRYTGLDTMSTAHSPYNSMEYFVTIADGIIWCVESASVDSLDVTLVCDAVYGLTECTGTAVLFLMEGNGTSHSLQVKWTETLSDFGTSELPAMDPTACNRWF